MLLTRNYERVQSWILLFFLEFCEKEFYLKEILYFSCLLAFVCNLKVVVSFKLSITKWMWKKNSWFWNIVFCTKTKRRRLNEFHSTSIASLFVDLWFWQLNVLSNRNAVVGCLFVCLFVWFCIFKIHIHTDFVSKKQRMNKKNFELNMFGEFLYLIAPEFVPFQNFTTPITLW